MDYSVIEIPIYHLMYKILHPQFKDQPVDEYMKWVVWMQNNLPIMEFPHDHREANMMGVYKSIVETGVIKRPLVIKRHWEPSLSFMCYVVVGNQRFCCLRALRYFGNVPCVVSQPGDGWGDDQPGALVEMSIPYPINIIENAAPIKKVLGPPRDFVI